MLLAATPVYLRDTANSNSAFGLSFSRVIAMIKVNNRILIFDRKEYYDIRRIRFLLRDVKKHKEITFHCTY